MKKLFYAIAALTLILSGCAKELDNSTKDNFSKVRLHVKVADQLTKVSADNDGRYHWQAGDKITVFNDAEDAFEFSTEDGGSDVDFGATSWSGNLGEYAMYPASGNHFIDEDEILFDLPSSYDWSANSTNMPMLGKISADVATFKAVGGVLKLVCYNIPSDAVLMEFSATNKQISGVFEIADGTVPTPVITTAAMKSSNNIVNFDFTGNRDDNMVFYIPLPTGTIDGFTVSFLSDDPDIVFTKTTTVNLTVGRNQMIIAPTLNCTAIADAVLTNSEILDSDISGTYGTGSITSASGTWNYSACTQSYKDLGKTYIQIRNNATVSYLQLPSFSNNIASITLHNIANGSNSAYTGTVYFRDEASNDADPIASATCDVGAREDFVLNIPSGNTTGYIMSSGPCRFYAVTVKFVNAGTFPSLTATDDELEIAVGSLTATTTVSLTNPVDALGISCVVNEEAKDWLSASISGSTLTVTAAGANGTASDREGTVTLKATGAANVVITVTQPTMIVANPTVTATAGDAKFTATWAGVPHATSYVAYLHTAPTATPATGGTNISASISESAGTYSITDYAVTNDTHYYLYVKVNEVESNYEAVSEYVVKDFTPAEAKGTAENPYWASEAYDYIKTFGSGKGPDDPIYVKGYVSTASDPTSNYQTYYISDDGTTTKQFQAYRGKGISGANITDANRVYVGDYVVVSGTAINYNGDTPEFSASSQIVTHYYLDIDYDEVEWAWNETSAEDFTVSINSTGDYKTFTHSESGMDWATVSVVENVITITPKDNNESLVADREGTVTIHHASDLLEDIVISCKQTKVPAHGVTAANSATLGGDENDTQTVTVACNYDWEVIVTEGDTKISASKTNSTTVTVTALSDGPAVEGKVGTIRIREVDNPSMYYKDVIINQEEHSSSSTATISVATFGASTKPLGQGTYTGNFSSNEEVTVDGLALSAEQICQNNKNTPSGADKSNFIVFRYASGGHGFMYNTSSLNIKSIVIRATSAPTIKFGATSNPTASSAASYTTGSSSTLGGVSVTTYTITVPSGSHYFVIQPTAAWYMYDMVVTY